MRRRDEPAGHALLAFAADVAGQDDRDVAQPNVEHDGVVVADALTLPVRGRWVEDANLDAGDDLPVAGLHRAPRRRGSGGGGRERAQARVRRDRHPFPHGCGANRRSAAGAPPM